MASRGAKEIGIHVRNHFGCGMSEVGGCAVRPTDKPLMFRQQKTPITGWQASGGFQNSEMMMIHSPASVKTARASG